MGIKITIPSSGEVSDASALKKAANLSDLPSVSTALSNLGIDTIPGRVTSLEGKHVRSTRFEIISSGTSGSVTLPSGATVVLDDFGGTVDAVTAEVAGGRPVFNHPRDSNGDIVTASFDSSGNWVLSAAPTSYPIAIIYRVRQTLLNFNASDSSIVGEYQIFGAIDLSQSSAATGVLQSASMPALTGDVTNTAGTVATTIANNVVSNAKLAQIATSTIKGRITSGTGNVEDLTAANVLSILGIGGARKIKVGTVSSGSFSGNPKKATVTFGNAFSDATYGVIINGVDSRQWAYESKAAGSFVINSHANAALTGEVSWIAIDSAESIE